MILKYFNRIMLKSIGTNSVLYLLRSFIKLDDCSLLAIKILLLNFIITIVVSRPINRMQNSYVKISTIN